MQVNGTPKAATDAAQVTAEEVLTELQDIDAKLISGSQKTQIVGALTIANNALTVIGSLTIANNNAAVLAQIAAAQTNSTQKIQMIGGAGAANAATIDATGAQRIAMGEVVLAPFNVTSTGATSAIDTEGYVWATISWTGSTNFSGTVQVSPDGVNRWNNTYYDSYVGASGSPVSGAFNNVINGVLRVPLNERFLRLNLTTVLGTTSVEITLHAWPFPGWNALPAVATGTYTVAGTATVTQGAGIGTNTPWGVGGANIGTSNNGSTTTVAGTTLTYINCLSFFGASVIIAGGTVSALTVVIEGSNDAGANWFTIATYTGTANAYFANTSKMPFTAVRTRITTLTALTGTPTVTTRIGATI